VAYFKLSEKGRCAVAWVGFEGPMELRDAVKFALRRSSPEQQPRHERKQEKKEKKDSLKKNKQSFRTSAFTITGRKYKS
jgi:hypothetical protein